jgi:hypothetical protein
MSSRNARHGRNAATEVSGDGKKVKDESGKAGHP